MNEQVRDAILTTFTASAEGRMHFDEVIAQLMALAVESYQVDYRSGRATYFLPDGDTLDLAFERPERAIPEAFDGDAVRAAIRGAQAGKVLYPEFKQLTQQAGCIGYTVWISGRHVAYMGRRGEVHIERFPD